MKSGKRLKIAIYGALILVLPVVAYVVSRAVVYYSPMQNTTALILVCLAITLVLMGVPYLMLKILFHNAHLASGERELKLKDLPKNAQKPKDYIIDSPKRKASGR